MADRGLSPVVGTVLVVALTVLATGVAGTMLAASGPNSGPPTARLRATADAGADRIAVTHRGGDALHPGSISLHVRVEDRPLEKQPPVPFFAADGFVSGPTGPFNRATDDAWTAGETGSFRLASTNEPLLSPGDSVVIEVVVEGEPIARLSTTAT